METMNFDPAFATIEKRAKADGVEVELLVERGEKFSVSFSKGKADKFDSSATHCAGLRVILDGAEGYSFSENLGEDALLAAYKEALENAKFVGDGADPSRKVRLLENRGESVSEMAELFNDSNSTLTVEQKLDRARTLEEAALRADSRISAVPYTSYTETASEVQILTSTGIRRKQRHSGVFGYTYCLAKQGEDSRMDGEKYFTRDASKFDAEAIAKEAAHRAILKLGAVPPETGRYPVVIDNEVATALFGQISDYFSAKSVFEKSSLFGNDLGKTIASSKLTIVDDPFFRGGLGSRAFDGEGAPSQVTPLITEGKLERFLTNSVYAQRMDLPHTANAARSARSELDISFSNMVIKPGTKTLEELLAAYPRVIYITEFSGWHAGFKPGSGDFSMPAEGQLWENGKFVRPLANFVVAGNMRDLLRDIEDVSDRMVRPTGSVVTPDLLIRELSVAGK